MNAKKIMGAVLVALLAAALFVGAGAADELDIGSFPAYTALSGYFYSNVEYVADDGTIIRPVTADGTNYYFAAGENEIGKTYKGLGIAYNNNGNAIGETTIKFTLVAPTAPVSALYGVVSIIGQTVSKDVAQGTVYNSTLGITPLDLVFIDANGVVYNANLDQNKKATSFDFTPGKWAVAANLTGKTGIGAPNVKIIGQPYYFTVAKTDASITAAKDTVNIGENIIISVLVPGKNTANVYFNDAKVEPVLNQAGVSGKITDSDGKTYVTITLGIDGAGSAAFKAEEKGKATFTLGDSEVEVTIEKGVITAVADEDFFYIGNPIAISGTTTAGDKLYFYIEGTNFGFMRLTDGATVNGVATIDMFSEDLEVENGAWTVEINSNAVEQGVKTLVAGTYTVVVSTVDAYADADATAKGYKTLKEYAMSETYGTAAVTLTQPFITNVKAAAVAVQGTDYKITGTAIAAADVKLYVFGTSFFIADAEPTDDDEVFEFLLPGSLVEEMAPGTYFYLIQHPMNDKIFNVWNETDGDFFYQPTNSTGGKTAGEETFIFNVWKRGTNFAAQALLEAIAGQDIDDVFVQGTFEVEAQKLTINPIPAEVAKGTALTISGSTNSGEGVEVIVNVLAGKFGATVKGDENSATFLTAKAVTEEDGTFEAAIDTSKLEVGSYIVTVEIAGTMYDSAAVEIVDKAPVTPEQPDTPVTPEQPEQPEQPTEPTTPGFGALAALAGLGAVAVLLLRRE